MGYSDPAAAVQDGAVRHRGDPPARLLRSQCAGPERDTPLDGALRHPAPSCQKRGEWRWSLYCVPQESVLDGKYALKSFSAQCPCLHVLPSAVLYCTPVGFVTPPLPARNVVSNCGLCTVYSILYRKLCCFSLQNKLFWKCAVLSLPPARNVLSYHRLCTVHHREVY